MITQQEINSIDTTYFTVLQAGCYAIYLKSSCGHYWGLLLEQNRTFKHYKVYHKHHSHNEYHRHRDAKSIKVALQQIKQHDAFQLNGRKPVKPAPVEV